MKQYCSGKSLNDSGIQKLRFCDMRLGNIYLLDIVNHRKNAGLQVLPTCQTLYYLVSCHPQQICYLPPLLSQAAKCLEACVWSLVCLFLYGLRLVAVLFLSFIEKAKTTYLIWGKKKKKRISAQLGPGKLILLVERFSYMKRVSGRRTHQRTLRRDDLGLCLDRKACLAKILQTKEKNQYVSFCCCEKNSRVSSLKEESFILANVCVHDGLAPWHQTLAGQKRHDGSVQWVKCPAHRCQKQRSK